jgi:catechol 2,3-dioxygenase-like lactoylglutathione lyase family enzyme
MNLVVIRVSDLERSRGFYSTLGLALNPEKHGAGPLHYSCVMNDVVVELYPTKKRVTGGGRIGLRVAAPEDAVDRLQSAGHLFAAPVRIRRDPEVGSCWSRIRMETTSSSPLCDLTAPRRSLRPREP